MRIPCKGSQQNEQVDLICNMHLWRKDITNNLKVFKSIDSTFCPSITVLPVSAIALTKATEQKYVAL